MSTKTWTEKYRPKSFTEIAYQEKAVTLLNAAIHEGTIPHMLLYGPPGTGKTSLALLVARKLFKNAFRDRVLELNASDDRGIDVVRYQIKHRASRSISKTDGIPDFQLIILDEADCMTTDAQKALLRTMEVYSEHTRFIVICNYVSRIISPLASRCGKIGFQSLPRESMKERIVNICESEQVVMEDGALEILIKAARGDLRRAIMLLESAAKFCKKKISQMSLLDLSGHVPNALVDDFWAESEKGPAESHQVVKNIIWQGYSAQQLISQLTERILHSTDYNELQKAIIFEIIAEVDHDLSSGANEALQLLLVGSSIAKVRDCRMITD